MSEIVNVATHSFSLKQMCEKVAEQSADLGAQSAQQLKTAAMSFDERKTFAATKEDLEQNTAGHSRDSATTEACDSEGTENDGCRTASVH